MFRTPATHGCIALCQSTIRCEAVPELVPKNGQVSRPRFCSAATIGTAIRKVFAHAALIVRSRKRARFSAPFLVPLWVGLSTDAKPCATTWLRHGMRSLFGRIRWRLQTTRAIRGLLFAAMLVHPPRGVPDVWHCCVPVHRHGLTQPRARGQMGSI